MNSLSEKDIEELRALEEELWRSETRFDNQRMRQIISEDFFEYGASGRTYDFEAALSHSPQDIDAELPLPKFSVRLLAPDVAQTTYNGVWRGDGNTAHSRRSSIWTRSNGSWWLRFHQGTPYEPSE